MKHVILFFLSDIHLNDKTDEFRVSIYEGKDGKRYECIQTNESAIDFMMDRLNNQIDALFYFSTQKTKEELSVWTGDKFVTKTHVDWFKERIIGKYPVLKSAFHGVDYDEDKDTDEGIRQVTEMTERIKKYLDESADKDISLYVDMTGGFRHASMMMLSVMQLLNQYKGIEIKNVLYSNWGKKKKKIQHVNNIGGGQIPDEETLQKYGIVEDVTELHRMFTLISGTDEFVNFGSVKEIEKYFEDRDVSPSLLNLTKTMREFSDAIKICRTSKIMKVVKQLQQCITAFSREHSESVHEKIFLQIISILQEEYGKLLLAGVTQIDIIRWCIDKGFLQQAMTLCTEWLPFILVEKKICYTDDNKIKLEAASQGLNEERSWQQSFIIGYNKKGISRQNDRNEQLSNQIGLQKAIDLYLAGKADDEAANAFKDAREPLLNLFSECKRNPHIMNQLNLINASQKKQWICEFETKTPMLAKACRVAWKKNIDANDQYREGLIAFISRLRSSDALLKGHIKGLPGKFYPELFGIEKSISGEKKDRSPEEKRSERIRQYELMIQAGVMKTDYPDDVIKLLMGYYDIRVERNHINHANDNRGTDSDKRIDEMMRNYLDLLEKY